MKKKQFKNANDLADYLMKLHEERYKSRHKKTRRSLNPEQRTTVFKKTNGICHICGGKLDPNKPWQADHIVPHVRGGEHSLDNYLPAHSKCNRSRWLYSPEEFELILELGVWLKTKIEKREKRAIELSEGFVKRKARP